MSLLLLLTLLQNVDTLDNFEKLDNWSPHPADGVQLALVSGPGRDGFALGLRFAFTAGAGYAIARRTVDMTLSDDFEFSFWIKGPAPDNTLEFKLLDGANENVWWTTRRDFHFPSEWTRIRIKRRHIAFAWGPHPDAPLRRVTGIEIVVTAGTGGRGTVWIDDFALRTIVRDSTPVGPLVSASSGNGAAALDGNPRTSWRPDSGAAHLTIDFQRPLEFGGLVLDWDSTSFARDYTVLTSDDRDQWSPVYSVRGGDGGRDYLWLPESESRYLRLDLEKDAGHGYALRELVIEPLAFGESRNGFFQAIAHDAQRGNYPRYLDTLQSYWTVIGAPGDASEALLNEQGALEIAKGGITIEPFLDVDGRVLTWADVATRASLLEGDLPIPSVRWQADSVALEISAFAHGPPGAATLYARYRVENTSGRPTNAALYLTLRSFQVLPPWQQLNMTGGVSRLEKVSIAGKVVTADGHRVFSFTAPSGFGAARFDEGDVVSGLRHGRLPAQAAVVDSFGAATGVLAYRLALPAHGASRVAIAVPFHGARFTPPTHDMLPATARAWRDTLSHVRFTLPPAAQRLARTARSSLAYILINQDGPALQPGSRSYARSWIRDGALESAALLRFGHSATVRRFIQWYAGFQYPNGKIPCCVDARGADPVDEHDSHGEFIYLVAEYFRFTHDTAFLRALWPRIRRTVGYIDSLRRTPTNLEYRGLLPPSISHEGYSAKPMHSFWDDFWALRGLKDAAFAALILHDAGAASLAALRDSFRTDLLAALRVAMERHHIDFIPGAADLGDFDATSTTIAVAPVDATAQLPRGALDRTFQRYYDEFRARADGKKDWDAYTPYELRVVGTMVRLGQPDRAHELLDFFFEGQRPEAWNQWAEVVWRERDIPRFIGDMPHTWVAADFLRSFADLFAFEREADSTLVVGAGVPRAWLESGTPVTVEGLGTHYGVLDLTLRRVGNELRVRIGRSLRIPPGGIVVKSPSAEVVVRDVSKEIILGY